MIENGGVSPWLFPGISFLIRLLNKTLITEKGFENEESANESLALLPKFRWKIFVQRY
jgi:hypothetical protein